MALCLVQELQVVPVLLMFLLPEELEQEQMLEHRAQVV
jgi:hypothetical protein